MIEYVLIKTLSCNKLSIDDKSLINLDYKRNELINTILKKRKMKAEIQNE